MNNSYLFTITIAVFANIFNFYYSQDKSINIDLDRNKYQQPKYTFYDNDKVIVYYASTQRLEKKEAEFFGSLKCYNMNLEELWTVDRFDVLPINYKEERQKYMSIFGQYTNWDIKKTNSTEYVYMLNRFEKRISLINTNTGNIEVINLPTESILDDNTLFDYNLFVEGNHAYFLYKKENVRSGVTAKEFLTIDIFDYDINKKSGALSTFEILSLGSVKDLLTNGNDNTRQWLIDSFINGKFYFSDSFSIQDKNDGGFYKRVLSYDINGSLIVDKMIKLGSKIADGSMSGELHINPFNNKFIYTYAIDRDAGTNFIHYRKFDENLELVWEEKFDSEIKMGSVQKIISGARLSKTCDEAIRIWSSYGNNIEFDFLINADGSRKFNRIESKKECEIPFKYNISCSDYNKLSANSKAEKFVIKQISSVDEHRNVFVFECDNSFVIVEQPFQVISSPQPYIGLYLFNK